MTTLMKVGGFVSVGIGFVWIAYVIVAVATGIEGFGSLAAILPALAFHAVFALLGAHLLGAAARRADQVERRETPAVTPRTV